MAQARLLNKTISLSEKVADLPDDSTRLLYTWMITHTDDVGLLPDSARTIKATVVPMLNLSVEDIGFQLESMLEVGLLMRIQYGSKTYLYLVGHERYQTLKKDRQPSTILEYDSAGNKTDNWDFLDTLIKELTNNNQWNPNGIQMEDIGIQMEAELKRKEKKRKEGKGSAKGRETFAPNGAGKNLSGYELARKTREALG